MALLPCSAQEETVPTTPPACSPADEEQGAAIDNEELESALEKAAALQELLDDEKFSTDLRADSATMRCFNLLGDVLEVRHLVREGALPESHEGVQKLNAAIQRILQSTHGSDDLKLALLGLEVEEALAAAGKDTEVLSDYIDDGEWFNDNCSLVVEFLQEITDKDRADKLAGPHQFRSCFNNLRHVLTERKALEESIDVDAPDQWLKQLTGTPGKNAEASLREAIAACAAKEPPFFGSEKLQELLSRLDTPFTEQDEELEDKLLQDADSSTDDEEEPDRNFTPEEEQHARAMLETRLQIYIDLKESVFGIKDKETAEAAAPVLQDLVKKLEACMKEFDEWMDERRLPAAVNALYRAEYKGKEKPVAEASELQLARLSLLDEALYGSPKLLEAVTVRPVKLGGDGKPDTSTPEEKEEVRQRFNSYFAVTDEIRHIIITVVDKETADAAATRLKDLLAERSRKDKEMSAFLDDNERYQAAAYAIWPEYQAKLGQLNFLDQYLRYGLPRMEQPCYGSEALLEVLSASAEPETDE